MATLTIRNLNDSVVDKLKQRSKTNHRSLEAEVRALLEEAAKPDYITLRDLAERLAALSPRSPHGTDSVELLREDRDR